MSWVFILATVIKALVVLGLVMTFAGYLTLAERKIAGWIQNRHGPNRVGPWGLLQPLADGTKLFFKEELTPAGANPWLFVLAPALVACPAILAAAVIPFGDTITILDEEIPLIVADIPVGILYFLAVASFSVFGLLLAGWSSNNKYSLMGGLRAGSQVISYELAMILSVIVVIMLAGSMSPREIALDQQYVWNVFRFPMGPLAFLIFWIASFAETNRAPFDMVECESELVGGFHTEYSSMRWSLFFIGEYAAMFVQATMLTTLFCGGHTLFGLESCTGLPWLNALLGLAIFFGKTSFFLFCFLWVRWTLPRFRWDQIMNLGWKVMLPAALVNILIGGALMLWTELY